jgi:predicted ATPase/DNA-binding SARP family transcriptional activator
MLKIRLLGRFEVKRDEQIIKIGSHPAQLLLAYLALKAGQASPRALVAGKLWPDRDEASARTRLRGEKSKLIQALGVDDLIETDGELLEFDPKGKCWVDVRVFAPDRPVRSMSVDELLEAVTAYGGDFLQGYYEEWVDEERELLKKDFGRKLKELFERLATAERWKDLRHWSQEYLNKVERTDEEAFCALVSAHFQLGDVAQIKSAYDEFVRALKMDLDLPASDKARDLVERLLRSKPPKPKPSPSSASNLAPLEANLPPTPQLPPFATPFVGREVELAKVRQNLADPVCRLLNVMGLGGTGKTRLMCEVLAAPPLPFADGVFFVSLVAATTVEQMVMALADNIGLSLYGKTAPRAQLIDYVREKHLLLGLDNLEQVEGAGELIDEILDNAPHIKLITTSQGRLGLEREWILDLDGLNYPTSETEPNPLGYEAVQLFDRAAKRLVNREFARPELQAVAHLTRLVEGLPLALELAAAWLRALSISQIVSEVERTLGRLSKDQPNLPKRHHSLRAVFEHSWGLLAEDEKKLFKQLAVFQGGFQKEAVERVVRAPFSLLISLREKSLVRRAAGERFELHTLLRRFAEEKLQDPTQTRGERPAEVEMRLADYFSEFASLHQGDYAQLEPEWGNLHAALRAAHRHQMWAVVLGLADSLSQAWLASNHLTEAREMYALACEAARASQHPRGVAEMLSCWGRVCIEQSDYAEAQAHLRESLTISRAHQDLASTASALYNLGYCAVEKSEWNEAEQFFAESQQIRGSLGDTSGLAEVIFERARVRYHADRITDCIELATQALQMQQASSQPSYQIRILRLLANAYVEQRFTDPAQEPQLLEQAWQACQQALLICEVVQNHDERALVLRSMASIAKLRNDLEAAQGYVSQSLQLSKRKGNRRDQAIASHELGMIYMKLGQFLLALETAQHTLNLCQQLDDRFGSVYVLTSIGDAYLGLEQPTSACQTWQEALAITRQFPTPHPQTELLDQRLRQNQC